MITPARRLLRWTEGDLLPRPLQLVQQANARIQPVRTGVILHAHIFWPEGRVLVPEVSPITRQHPSLIMTTPVVAAAWTGPVLQNDAYVTVS